MINVCINELHACAKYLGANILVSGWNIEKCGEKRTLFFVEKSILCPFFREWAGCCMYKIVLCTDICNCTSFEVMI